MTPTLREQIASAMSGGPGPQYSAGLLAKADSILSLLTVELAAKDEAIAELVAGLEKRADWLHYEREHGGDYEHLSTREKECRYLLDKLRAALRADTEESKPPAPDANDDDSRDDEGWFFDMDGKP